MKGTRPLARGVVLGLVATFAVVSPGAAEPTWTEYEQLSAVMGGPEIDVLVAPDGTATVGWVEDIGGVDRAVARTRALAGVWSAPIPLSPTTGDTQSVRLGIDDAGVVTATWAHRSTGGVHTIQAATRTGASWSAAATVAVAPAGMVYDEPEVAVARNGRVAIAWTLKADSGEAPRVGLRLSSGGWQVYSVDSQSPGVSDLQVVADNTGRTTLAWLRNDGTHTVVRSRVFGGTAEEALTRNLSPTDENAYEPRLATNAAGRSVASWTQRLGAGTRRVWAVLRTAGAPWPVSGTVLTDAVSSASTVTAPTVTPTGEASVVYERSDVLFHRVHRGGWLPGVAAANAGPGVLEAPALASDDSGRLVLAWSQSVGSERRVRSAVRMPDSGWQDDDVISAASREGRDPVVAGSANGDAVVAWRDRQPVDSVGAAGLDGSGPVTRLKAPPVVSLPSTVRVHWSAQDRWSAVASHTVQRQITAWNGRPGQFTGWLSATPGSSAVVPLGIGRTACLRVRATDALGNTGGFTAPRCTTRPVDDRQAKVRSGRWRALKKAAAFRSTYREARAKGARLEWRGARGRIFDLVVSTGPRHGKVSVWLGKTRLRTVSLRTTKPRSKVVIRLRTLAAPRKGTVQVRVVSSRRPVRIDGLVVRR